MQTATNMRHQLAFVPSLINVQDEKLLDKSVVGRTKIVTFRNTNGSYIPGQIQTLPRKYEEVTFKLQLATTASPLPIGCWTIKENKVFHCTHTHTERERERERGGGVEVRGSERIWLLFKHNAIRTILSFIAGFHYLPHMTTNDPLLTPESFPFYSLVRV